MIISSYDNNIHEFGYYQVGAQKFTNKIQAILAADASHQFPYFIMNDESYSCFDWTVEPSESLESLYAKRAWEIRNKYDYLVLHFSGGSDSANVLETFINNNIPLEEILIRMPMARIDLNINNTSATNSAAENVLTALPLAKLVKEKYYPHLKITLKDSSEYLKNYFHNLDLSGSSDVLSAFSSISPGSFQNADLDELHNDLKDVAESGKKIGHVYGTDKPPIYWDGEQYAIKFLDKTAGLFFSNSRKSSVDLPQYKEAFYWAASTAPLIIKQAHTIKRAIQAKGLGPEILTKLTGRPRHNFLADIIYNRTLPLPFSPEKTRTIGITNQDFWFFEDKNSDHVKNWQKMVTSLDFEIDAKWKHDGSMFNDLVGVYSKSYGIGA